MMKRVILFTGALVVLGIAFALYAAFRTPPQYLHARLLHRTNDVLGMHFVAVSVTNSGNRRIFASFKTEEFISNSWEQVFIQSTAAHKDWGIAPGREFVFNVPTPAGRWRIKFEGSSEPSRLEVILKRVFERLRIKRRDPPPFYVTSEMPVLR